jgi:hypothetical protein
VPILLQKALKTLGGGDSVTVTRFAMDTDHDRGGSIEIKGSFFIHSTSMTDDQLQGPQGGRP